MKKVKLYGMPVSGYYNMVKHVMLEKGVEFEEIGVMYSQEDDFKKRSPMGKIPFIETEEGNLCEASVMATYIDAKMPGPRMIPTDPFAAAKVMELSKIMELYIELRARRHIPELYYGEPRNTVAAEEGRPVIENGLEALRRLASFDPFLCGEFGFADIVAVQTFFYAVPICRVVHDWDIVSEVPGLQDALDAAYERPSTKIVVADAERELRAWMTEQKLEMP